ncbi:MAG: hypothetical protein CL811_12335 [Colwelliaceae bacterium]|jgi:hypothetical protein|nr:hypothetical protein [Colwelliaceae bacterium]
MTVCKHDWLVVRTIVGGGRMMQCASCTIIKRTCPQKLANGNLCRNEAFELFDWHCLLHRMNQVGWKGDYIAR